MHSNLPTEILLTLKDYPTSTLTVRELAKIINPLLSFSLKFSDSIAYEKIQQLVILENLLLLRDQGLVNLSETNEAGLSGKEWQFLP
ncbi:hypothetical protein [Flavobacterium olei]|uniref:hypothetical protein n=1 Tax=Flavobacterium olei TaxID=1886782 RepID=UPI003219A795